MSNIAKKEFFGGFRGLGGSSLLFFFLLLVIIFCFCPLFHTSGDSLLFFFLLLIVLFGGRFLFGGFGRI